ncbi:hypothetical protein V2S66_08430 [Streptomyces sp. V4-01]|uniref:DoxX family protein n=1 Tax=Actinacidiphila polyblastidii TaxID=3110430 RepID=A0ABU7P864_9ACTN|nr:hypothetical protein [Streptomyces sp. V4-01]
MMKLREVPTRAATGAFILRSGWQKWKGDEETARGLHGFATGTYPFLGKLEPRRFMRLLAVSELTVGTLLLTPVVPTLVAGAALTGFSGGLLGLYARTPGMREPGTVWPTQDGVPLAKDSWMVGIGLGLIADAVASDRGCGG